MSISTNELIIALCIAFVLGGSLAYLFWKQRRDVKRAVEGKSAAKQGKAGKQEDSGSSQLQLQAYERLILLADRIALPNLIGRLNQQGLSAREMQSLLTQNIRQ